MKTTWDLIRECKDDDESLELRDRRRRECLAELPRLVCCKPGSQHVGLSYDPDSLLGPVWKIGSYWSLYSEHNSGLPFDERIPPPINFCPFCGECTPELKLRSVPPERLHHSTDGYYCDCCSERCNSCYCSHPAAAFEIS